MGYTTAKRDDFFDKSYYQDNRSPQEHVAGLNQDATDLKSKRSTISQASNLGKVGSFPTSQKKTSSSTTQAEAVSTAAKKGK